MKFYWSKKYVDMPNSNIFNCKSSTPFQKHGIQWLSFKYLYSFLYKSSLNIWHNMTLIYNQNVAMLHVKQIALLYPWQASVPILLPRSLRALWCCCGGLGCRVACCGFVCRSCGYVSFDCGNYGCGFCGSVGCGFCGSVGCGLVCCWWWQCGSVEIALVWIVKCLAKSKQDHFFKKIVKQF